MNFDSDIFDRLAKRQTETVWIIKHKPTGLRMTTDADWSFDASDFVYEAFSKSEAFNELEELRSTNSGHHSFFEDCAVFRVRRRV